MIIEESAMETVRREIIRFVKETETATQEKIIQALNWPSVLVSYALGTLVEEGRLERKGQESNPIFKEAAFRMNAGEIPRAAS